MNLYSAIKDRITLILRKAKRKVLKLFSAKTQIRINHLFGIDTPMATQDRYDLENIIFPYYQKIKQIRKVLFVGVDWYTTHYYKLFSNKEYWTIDPQKNHKKWAKNNHIVDSIQNLSKYVKIEYFDLIIINADYGYGVDSKNQCETAFKVCYDFLRYGGEFILGWDDHPKVKSRTVPLDSIESLKKFNHKVFPPFQTWRFITNSEAKKVYDFYVKQ